MSARRIDAIAVRGEGPLLLLGRLAVGALYLPAGWHHLTDLNGFSQYVASFNLPGPTMAWAVVAAIFEFFGSLAIVLGVFTRYAAAALILFTLFAAFLGHPYWSAADAQQMNQRIHFYKDLAIIGGLLFLFVRGPGPLSIDRR